MPDAVTNGLGARSRGLGLRGISLFGPMSWAGGHLGRQLQAGVSRSNSEGNPAPPSLKLAKAGFWRFRWAVKSGTRTVTVYVKQAANTTPYPSLTVRANTDIGVNSDASGTSPGGAGWVTLGPVAITPTATGAVWVELWNNLALDNSPAFFDHIVVT
jgi:hypothetical protein